MQNHILLLVISITIYIVCSSFINTYIFSKAKNSILLVSYITVASSMLLWSVAKLLEVVSPTEKIKSLYLNMEIVLILLIILTLISFFIIMYSKPTIIKKSLMLLPIVLLLIITIATWGFLNLPLLLTTYVLILTFLSFNLYIFFYKHIIFPEMDISLDSIVQNIKDRVAVFDSKGLLVDMNLKALLEILVPSNNKTLVSFLEHINSFSEDTALEIDKVQTLENEYYKKEICIKSDINKAYYVFTASIIKNKKGSKVGTVCTLRDITENKLISLEIDNKNTELQRLNKELGDFLKIADSLAEEKEHAKISREITSTVGQKLVEILTILEVIKLTNKEDSSVFEIPLNEAIQSCRQVLTDIRVVVSRLIPDKEEK